MKYLFIFLSIILSASLFAEIINLDRDEINFGSLSQNGRNVAHESFSIRRDAVTPKKVKFYYNINVLENVCAYWDYRDVWVPGYSTTECEFINGRQICRQIYHPGYYRQERYCGDYELVLIRKDKKVVLNFKKAHKLAGDSFEVFNISIEQEKIRSSKTKTSGVLSEGVNTYNIYQKRKFLNTHLIFKKK